MELWIQENQTENLALKARVKETLFTKKSIYQEIGIFDTEEFGRMLVLDGVFQTSEFEEFVYHEMIVHVPFYTHKNPERVLIIGGGDGGSAREALRHKDVKEVRMVEIDGDVVEACKKYLKQNSIQLIEEDKEPRFTLEIGDGIKHVEETENYYDIIIVDCSDPIGPGEGLFTKKFYQNVLRALREDGIFVQQTESPFYHQELLKRVYKDVSTSFNYANVFLANIPIYPGGLHTFTIGSKKYDPLKFEEILPRVKEDLKYQYYNKDIHKAAFALPQFFKEILDSAAK
ncbi:polyamine aminopropyltransferase [Selenomonadales bacterium OttesenSCG-928-I06]|nr:polyamine aminopropyltransferase [Selenomonadales bacterium OttesenSCG-928-I06]